MPARAARWSQRWPDLEVYVHERGARHMARPERLLESARMLYGEDMDRLWGEMVPVPEQNLRVLHGGETLFDGAFEVAYTPGPRLAPRLLPARRDRVRRRRRRRADRARRR